MLRRLSSSGWALALAVAPASAQTVFIADLRGTSENPPVASPASGSALVLFDPAFQTMTVRTTFRGLTTPTVDGHIHCCAPPSANAVVAVGFRPAGFPLGVTAGEFGAAFNLNAPATYNTPFVTANGGTTASARIALINGTQAGLAYVNVHTSRFPGGEIRGQLFASDQLSPQAYSLLPEAALQTAEFQDGTIRGYLRDVRGADDEPGGQRASLDPDGRLGMVVIGSGRFGAFEGRAGRPRVDLGSTGVLAGIDYRFAPGTLVGLMGGYDASDVGLAPGSPKSHINSWFGGAYGSLALGPAYVDLHASYTRSDYDLLRRISVGTFNALNTADADSEQWMVSGTAGVGLRLGGFEIEPYAGARYIDLDLDAFAEAGSIAALTIGATHLESLQSIVGVRLGADLPVGLVSVRPSLRGEWRHEFENDDPRVIAGSFGGVGPFGFVARPLGDDHAVVGAGLAITGNGPLSLVADYTGQLGGGYEIHALSAGFRLSF